MVFEELVEGDACRSGLAACVVVEE